MNIFNQIAPRLSRVINRGDTQPATATREPDFTLKPAYEIQESADAWALTVTLPGVAKDGLEVSADAEQVVVRGRRNWRAPEGWTSLYRESIEAPYELTLVHENAVDAEKIAAELRDGVLRVSLPKAAAVKPRKITIN